ncbi:MAG: protein translocase SEC61 complex subunit gamma [Candidatus Woesearchaeota archaeon]
MEEEATTKVSIFEKLKRFTSECIRVLRVTKKPDRIEFATIVKVSALGIAIIGVIGFAIQMFWETVK